MLLKTFLAAAGISLILCLPARAQLDFNFMPKGGKTLLIEMLGAAPDMAEVRKLTAAKRTEAEWLAYCTKVKTAFSEKELKTLAAYLVVVMPLPEGALQNAEKAGDWKAALPMDGRELAWNNCQICHSFFSGYLTQDRDYNAWMNEFLAPFHRRVEMNEREKEVFARYSVINMPMKPEDVPADLRY